VTPTGLELSQDSQGNEQGCGVCPPYCPPSLSITTELTELLDLWQLMTDEERRDLLSTARGLAQAGVERSR
jgi:hypothetical protein